MWGASQTDSQLRNKGWSRANMRLMRNMLSVAEVVSFPRMPPSTAAAAGRLCRTTKPLGKEGVADVWVGGERLQKGT